MVLQEWRSQGCEILLLIDANEPISEKPGKMTTLLHKLKMTDLIRHRHPELEEPNTHIQGSNRIDFIFGTPRVTANCERAGILPFGMGYHSDHRAVFAAIHIEKILSTMVTTIDSITARKLQQATTKERETLNKLNSNVTDWADSDNEQYEKCDEIIVQSMLTAEQHARWLNTTPWSPIFGKAVSKKSFWKITLSLKINHTRPNDDYTRWAESVGIEDFKSISLKTVKAQLHMAQRELWEIEKQADDLRQQHLKELLTKAELDGGEQKVQKRIKILIRAQQQKQHFQRLKKIFKPQVAGGLSYILVPKDFKIKEYPYDPKYVDAWEPIQDHDEIQTLIQHRNIHHFGQAHKTPFTIPPLKSLTWQANTIEAKEIIEGSIPASFVTGNPYTDRVLHYIAKRELLPEIDTIITS
jgi:hypothetical protein